jgi:hypothetical protein
MQAFLDTGLDKYPIHIFKEAALFRGITGGWGGGAKDKIENFTFSNILTSNDTKPASGFEISSQLGPELPTVYRNLALAKWTVGFHRL